MNSLTISQMMEEIPKRYPGAFVKNDYTEHPVHYFLVELENGWQLGAGYGPTHYCDTRANQLAHPLESRSAEIAIFDPDGNWYHPESWAEEIMGWQDSEQIFRILDYLSGRRIT